MILLDTCALLWLVLEPERLTARAKAIIANHPSELIVSAISAFEIAVKARKNRLQLECPTDEWWRTALDHHGIATIPVTDEIALASVALPPHHNDPADRIIIATAQLLCARIVTSDGLFDAYGVPIEW